MKKAWLLALVVFCGCNTFSTTAIDRTENGCLVVNPNCPMKGVPVSLRVPTHLELKVIETTYWEKEERPGEKASLKLLSSCRKTRTVAHEICFTEKIFLVDPKRPAAGLQNYGFSFTSGNDGKEKDAGKGYLSKVEYKIDDQTIKESANLVSNVLGLVGALRTGANDPKANEGTLIATDRTVAYGRFDINSCSFEGDVEQFLDCHVNHAPREVIEIPQTCPSN